MMSAAEALQSLRQGNRRFLSGVRSSDLTSETRRNQLASGQEPFATILGCSDSRVPAEIIFDQGLGDLFVIRVAGNIVAPSQVGSVEFAAARFGTRLVVVLGIPGAAPFWPRWMRSSRPRKTSRGTCVPSLTAFAPPWKRCWPQTSGTTRMPWCGRPFGPTSVSPPTICATGPKSLNR